MQQAVCLKHWRLHGPAVVQLQKLASGDALRSAINDINTMMSQAGVDDDDTVQNYLFRMMSEEIDERNLQIPHRAKDVVVQRALGVVGSPTLNDIKKMVPKHKHNEVAEVVKRGPELIKSFIAPLEASIRKFSIEVLKGVKSTLINDNDAEVLRLRDHVSKAIRSIELSGNANAMSVLQHEMSKLGSVNNVSSSVEGIVFRYKGKTYKYTGAWAPVHQILALFKYGRKGVPKMSMYGAY
jgi:hypothetical protein